MGTLYIEPGSPWENGYIESFSRKLRDERLNGEIFDTLWEAQVLIEGWRRQYNRIRPHSSLGYRPPAPEAYEPHRTALGASPRELHREPRRLAKCRTRKPPAPPLFLCGAFLWAIGTGAPRPDTERRALAVSYTVGHPE